MLKVVKTGLVAALIALTLGCSGCWFVIAGAAFAGGAMATEAVVHHFEAKHATPLATPAK